MERIKASNITESYDDPAKRAQIDQKAVEASSKVGLLSKSVQRYKGLSVKDSDDTGDTFVCARRCL